MTGEEAKKAARMKKLLLKLAELADVLDDITRKMKTLAERQKSFTEKHKNPSQSPGLLLPMESKKTETDPPPFRFPIDNLQVFMVEKKSPSKMQKNKKEESDSGKMTYKEYVEFTSYDEYLRFKNMNPISPKEMKNVNFDELSKKLFPSL